MGRRKKPVDEPVVEAAADDAGFDVPPEPAEPLDDTFLDDDAE